MNALAGPGVKLCHGVNKLRIRKRYMYVYVGHAQRRALCTSFSPERLRIFDLIADITQIANSSKMATKDVQIEIQIAAKPPDTCIDSCGDVAGAKEHDKPTSPRDPQMQVLFDQTVCKELELPYLYQQVNVLIIRWADYLDRDLKCGDEVRMLLKIRHISLIKVSGQRAQGGI